MTTHAHYNMLAGKPYTFCGLQHKGDAEVDISKADCALCQAVMNGEREFSIQKAISPTQLKLKPAYRDKLARLAEADNRSMANMAEVLIDKAVDEMKRRGVA